MAGTNRGEAVTGTKPGRNVTSVKRGKTCYETVPKSTKSGKTATIALDLPKKKITFGTQLEKKCMDHKYPHLDAIEASNDSCSSNVAFICSSTCFALRTVRKEHTKYKPQEPYVEGVLITSFMKSAP